MIKSGLKKQKTNGFTIVELLIVVVVIAILAAITIISYNGISNRAKASAVASASEQAAKKVAAYAVINADQYPATLADGGITDGATRYQYKVNNSTLPRTFCVTATANNLSYFVSSTDLTPKAGACAGHARDGGDLITNLHTNPKVSGGSGYTNQTPAGSTIAIVPSAGPEGQSTYRITTTVAGQLRMQFKGGVTPVSVGDTFNYSIYAKASAPITGANFEIQYSSGWVKYPTQSLSTSWTRLSTPIQVPAGVTNITNAQLLTDGSIASGVTIEITKVQITAGNSLSSYGDGDSAGWDWNGTPNSSTSSGPAL